MIGYIILAFLVGLFVGIILISVISSGGSQSRIEELIDHAEVASQAAKKQIPNSRRYWYCIGQKHAFRRAAELLGGRVK